MIEQGSNKQVYDISASTTPLSSGYEITFDYFNDSDIKVYITGNSTDTLIASNKYEIESNSTSKKVIFNAGYTFATGSKYLSLIRELDIEQTLDLRNGEKIDAEKLEDALDKLTLLVEQINEEVNRSVVSSVSDSSRMQIPDADSRSGMLLGFDDDGEAIPVLTSDIEQKLSQALSAEETAIAKALVATQKANECANILSQVTAEGNTKIAAIDSEAASKIASLTSKCNELLANLESAYSTHLSNLQSAYNTDISNMSQYLQNTQNLYNSVSQMKQAVQSLYNTLDSQMDGLLDRLQSKETSLESTLTAKKNELAVQLESIKTSTESTLSGYVSSASASASTATTQANRAVEAVNQLPIIFNITADNKLHVERRTIWVE